MLSQIFVIGFAFLFLINGIISLPVLEKQINAENTNLGRQDGTIINSNESTANHSVLEEIKDAKYFPPSSGQLMHSIAVRIKNDDSNNTKNCAIKIWRENATETTDSPITIECDESRKKRNVSPNPNPPTKLSSDNEDVKKFASIGVEKYAHTMVNSKASSLNKIVDALHYPPGHSLLYKIKILMDNCNREITENCRKMQCIVYVWRDPVLDHPVSIECDPIRTKRMLDLDSPFPRVNSTMSKEELLLWWKIQQAKIASSVINNFRRKRDYPIKVNLDDPSIKKYAQMAIDKYGSPNLPDRKAIILNITDATGFPSNQIYEIKLKVGSTNCKKDNSDEKNCVYDPENGFNECEIKVFRNETVTMLCFGVGRRKRELLTLDDPEVKKYVDMAVDRHESPMPSDNGRKSILQKFHEAEYFPEDNLRYKIKLRIGSTNCTRDREENCVYDPEFGYDDCEIQVHREENKERIRTICSRIGRMKRHQEDKLTMDNPEIKKYVDNLLEKHFLPMESAKDRKLIIRFIKEVIVYPSSENLRYKIKLRIGTTNCTRGREEVNCVYDPEIGHEDCEIHVYREKAGEEPAIKTVCSSILRKKREQDLPVNLTMEHPEVKKYIDMVVDEHVSSANGAENKTNILHEFKGAVFYPPSSNLQYRIKLTIGSTNCTKGSDESNCQYDPEIAYADCKISVFRKSEWDPPVETECATKICC